jgi:hypothetical protein
MNNGTVAPCDADATQTVATHAQQAVAALRESGGLHGAGADAVSELRRLLSSPRDAEVFAAAYAALDADALPLLAAVLRHEARAPRDGDSAGAAACAHACFVVGALLPLVDKARCSAALASAPGAADVLVDVLEARGTADANLADSCTVPACDLQSLVRLMSRHRCCLQECSVVATDGAPLTKRCAGCRCAAFCCAEHQRQAWPRHKAVCRARAAVEAARTALLARSDTAGMARGGSDA